MKTSDELSRMIGEHEHKKATDIEYQGSYMCAYRELLCWMLAEEAKLEFEPSQCLDGPEAEAKAKIMDEYKRRARELKKQYGIT